MDLNQLDNLTDSYLDTLEPLVAPSLHLGCYNPGGAFRQAARSQGFICKLIIFMTSQVNQKKSHPESISESLKECPQQRWSASTLSLGLFHG